MVSLTGMLRKIILWFVFSFHYFVLLLSCNLLILINCLASVLHLLIISSFLLQRSRVFACALIYFKDLWLFITSYLLLLFIITIYFLLLFITTVIFWTVSVNAFLWLSYFCLPLGGHHTNGWLYTLVKNWSLFPDERNCSRCFSFCVCLCNVSL